MNLLVDIASWVFLVAGSVFCLVGGLGLLRLPDFYCRTHATSITDTLGAGFVLLGLVLQAGDLLVALKLVVLAILLYVTSPTSAHALVKAAFSRGVKAMVRPE